MNKKKVLDKIKNNKCLLLIFLLGLFLRLVGISHGSPYVISLDEPTVVKTAFSLIYNQPISRFDWPHFNFYFNFLIFEVFIKGRGLIGSIAFLKQFTDSIIPILWNDAFIFYIVSRIANVILSSLTIIPVYLLSRRVFNKKIAVISSFILALLPYHIFISHYTIQDGPMLFWLSVFIYYAYLLSIEKNNYFKNLILSAITLGIASSYKYNDALFGIFVPLFYLIKMKDKKELGLLLKSSALVASFSFIVFSIVNYRIYFDWKDFWSYKRGIGFLWQLKENSQALSVGSLSYLFAIKKHLNHLFQNTSSSVFIMFLVAPLLFVKAKSKSKTKKILNEESKYLLLFFVFTLFFFLFMARYGRSGSRYFLPVYGLISILSGYSFYKIYESLKSSYMKIIWSVAFFTPLIVSSFLMTLKFTVPTTFNIALERYYTKENKAYYVGESFSDINHLNDLGLKKFNNNKTLDGNKFILSEEKLDDIGIIKGVDMISNKNKLGSDIYIYEIIK